MLFYLLVIALAFFILLLIKAIYFPTKALEKTKVGLNNQGAILEERSLYTQLTEYTSTANYTRNLCVKNKILNGQVTNVPEVNAELELQQTLKTQRYDDETVQVILEVMLADLNTCNIEKLITLEYLKRHVTHVHLGSIKELFILCGTKNYLFDLQLYKLVMECEGDGSERAKILDFIGGRMSISPDLSTTKAS